MIDLDQQIEDFHAITSTGNVHSSPFERWISEPRVKPETVYFRAVHGTPYKRTSSSIQTFIYVLVDAVKPDHNLSDIFTLQNDEVIVLQV